MDDTLEEVLSVGAETEDERFETEDGLKVGLYTSESGARFLDLDWEPGSKWEFLDTIEPEFVLESLLSELFGKDEAEHLLDGIEILPAPKAESCGCPIQSGGEPGQCML
jgi:hypothetical protein